MIAHIWKSLRRPSSSVSRTMMMVCVCLYVWVVCEHMACSKWARGLKLINDRHLSPFSSHKHTCVHAHTVLHWSIESVIHFGPSGKWHTFCAPDFHVLKDSDPFCYPECVVFFSSGLHPRIQVYASIGRVGLSRGVFLVTRPSTVRTVPLQNHRITQGAPV